MDNEKEWIVKPQAGTAEEPEREVPVKGSAGPDVSPAPSAPEPELPADLPAAYKKLLSEKEDLYDRLLRKQAELENTRKRLQREKEDFLQHATADLIRALLPVLDGFERALNHRDAKVPREFYQGMELLHRNLLDILKRAGLTPIETAAKSFDPRIHQAVETVEAPGYQDQEIVQELQRGYKLRQRLLRPAIVKVAVTPREELGKDDIDEGSGRSAEPKESD
jgi:molecular chaperone GrpE